jgi:hypothetical protein
MRLALTTAGVLASLLVGGETRLYAQTFGRPPVNPAARPAYSPYLNLYRRGNPAINYYGLVVPQVGFANSITTLQQQTAGLGREVTTLEESATLPATGHAIQFQSHQRYFQTLRAGGASPVVAAGASTAPARPTPGGGGRAAPRAGGAAPRRY